MNPSNDSKDDNRPDDLIEAWIGALQGREHVPGMTASSRAGAMLHQLVLQAQRDRAEEDDNYAQGLIDRWVATGLIGSERRRAPAAGGALLIFRNWLRRRFHWLGISAFALASLSMGVWVTGGWQHIGTAVPDQDAGVMRGAETTLQVTASDPDALALRIGEVLQRSQIPFRRIDLPSGAVQLQAKLPTDAQAARQELTALGLAVPTHERLDLVFSKAR